ncbi:MAG: DUF6659 family protein [Nitrososphaerota archaeon]
MNHFVLNIVYSKDVLCNTHLQLNLADMIWNNLVEENIDFDALCDKVFGLDDKIRSCRVINHKGKLVAGGMRKGLTALEDVKKDEMLFMELSLRVRMRHEFDAEFGPVAFSLSYRGKIIILSFPMRQYVLFVTTERQIDLNKIPFKILEIIKVKDK